MTCLLAHLARLLLFVAAFAVCIQTSLQARAAPKPASIATIDFGYGNAMPHERWGPLRVTIAGGPTAFTGRLIVKYRQDALQSQSISVLASASAGALIPIEVVICLPQNPEDISIVLLDDRDRPIDRAVYGRLSDQSKGNLIPLSLDQSDGLIACIGRVSAIDSLTARWLGTSSDPWAYYYGGQAPKIPADIEITRRKRSARLHAAPIEPRSLSPSWAAFDALEAMIVRTEEVSDKVNEDSRNAVKQWVQGGGRLILQVDQIGESWTSWLPPEIAAQISIGDLVRLDRPQEIQRALHSPVLVNALAKKDNLKTPEETTMAGQPTPQAEPVLVDPSLEIPADLRIKLQPAAKIPGRTVSFSKSLERSGWTTAWSADGAHFIAQGPVGFGFVTIIGCDPALAAQIPNHEASYRLWLNVLQAPLEDWLSNPDMSTSVQTIGWWGIQNSGANEYQRKAIASVLNQVAEVPAGSFNPYAVLATVLASILLLALCIGPVDALLLKRLSGRHYSWLSALTWIAAMTALATFAPRLFRGELRTLIGRERVIDQIADQIADQLASSHVWTSTATGFFPDSSGTHQLVFNSPGVFFRGASITESYSQRSERDMFPLLRCEQGSLISEENRMAFSLPHNLDQGQWTFRTMFEEGPGLKQDRLHAELNIESGNCTIEVSPEISQAPLFAPAVRSATLQVGSMVLSLSASTSPPGRITLTGTALPTQRASEKINWALFWTPLNLPMVDWQVHAPGAQRRRLSIERRLCTGQYALLTLSLLDSTPDVRTNEEGARYQSGRTYRILIPLPTAATSFPAAGGEQ